MAESDVVSDGLVHDPGNLGAVGDKIGIPALVLELLLA
jgi:hypothetical protein